MFIALVLGLLITCSIIYRYLEWESKYWHRRGIPGPSSSVLYGEAVTLGKLHDPLALVIRDWAKEYGKLFGYNIGTRKNLVITDLDKIHAVFVEQFNEFYARRQNIMYKELEKASEVHLFESRGIRWKRLRALFVSFMSPASLQRLVPSMEESSLEILEHMRRHEGGPAFDIQRYFMEFALDTSIKAWFCPKTSNIFKDDLVDQFKGIAMRNEEHVVYRFLSLVPSVSPGVANFASNHDFRFMRDLKRFQDRIRNMLNTKLVEEEDCCPDSDAGHFARGVFKQLNEIDTELEGEKQITERVRRELTEAEFRSATTLFLVAGFDTTANALCFVMWMIAKNERVQNKCLEEIVEAGVGDAPFDLQMVSRLPYLEATIKETLRHYPIAARALSRTCMKSTTVDGMEIEKGTTIMAELFTVHFDKTLWGEDADEFRPERWLDPTRPINPLAYLSFGAGPRMCPGRKFSFISEKILLAHLIKNFEFSSELTNPTLLGSLIISMKEIPVSIRART